MRGDRNKQILYNGLQAASDRMLAFPKRPEYPKDFNALYGWLEDKVFNLFEAIRLNRYAHIRKMAGEVIITAAEIAELADKTLMADYIKNLEEGIPDENTEGKIG